MRRFADFLRSKGFYIALGTGIAAFVALMVVYNYTSTKDDLTREQAIDLNQPVQEDIQTADNELSDADNKNTEESQMVESDGVLKNEDIAGNTNADKKDETTETEDVDPTVAATSDGAEAEPSDDTPTITAGLEYDGEQSLTWPLVGNVILPYSMDTTVYFQTLDSYKCNPGMLIEGSEGSDVMAAYEGVVTSVDDTKEFGTVVRLDMGNGYEAVYGQLMNVCVGVGDTVSTAQNVGEIGPVSSYYKEEGSHLYFAITKDGVPVNPMSLIQ